jgi:hypothetical protein
MKMSALLLTGVMITAISIISAGCSPTGWATREIPTGSGLERGDMVTITQENGTTLTGNYEGMMNLPFAEYTMEYTLATQRQFDCDNLPSIGQRIEVATSLSETKAWKGQFLGFDGESLLLKPDGGDEPEKFFISSLTGFTGRDGKIFRGMMFRNLFVSGDIPLMSVFVLKNQLGTFQISINSVKKITIAANEDSPVPKVISMSGTTLRENLMR